MNPLVPTSPSETQAAKSPVDLEEQVRRRAFELNEQRGRENGHDLEDWLQAESEFVQQRTKSSIRVGGKSAIPKRSSTKVHCGHAPEV